MMAVSDMAWAATTVTVGEAIKETVTVPLEHDADNNLVIKDGMGTLIFENGALISTDSRLAVEQGTVIFDGTDWDGLGHEINGVDFMAAMEPGVIVGGNKSILEIRNGATVHAGGISTIGTWKGEGRVNVSGNGTRLDAAGSLLIGGNGYSPYGTGDPYFPDPAPVGGQYGYLTVSDGAVLEVGSAGGALEDRLLVIGNTGQAEVLVDGAGTRLISHGAVTVGGNGYQSNNQWSSWNSVLKLANGAEMLIDAADGYLLIGDFMEVTATVKIESGSSLTITHGNLDINKGVDASGISPGFPGNAELLIDGWQSSVTVGGDTRVGLGSSSTGISISNNGKLSTAGDTWLGVVENSVVETTVTNDGVLESGGTLYVGTADGAESNLTIEQMGSVRSSAVNVGFDGSIRIRDTGYLAVGSDDPDFWPDAAVCVSSAKELRVSGSLDLESEASNTIVADGGNIVFDNARLVKAVANNNHHNAKVMVARQGGSITGKGRFDLAGDIKAGDFGTIDLTMTAGSRFSGRATKSGSTDAALNLTLEGATWIIPYERGEGGTSLDTFTTRMAIINEGQADMELVESTLVFNMFYDGYDMALTCIEAVHMVIDSTVIKIVLDGNLIDRTMSFGMVYGSESYSAENFSFDLSEALLPEGYFWYTDDFEQYGIVDIRYAGGELPPDPVPEPTVVTLGLLGFASVMVRRRRR